MQLTLTRKELKSIGFKERNVVTENFDNEQINSPVWGIPTINGFFQYTENKTYRWYHVTKIGDGYRHTLLDIEKAPELFLVLSVFKVKYKLGII